MRENPENLDEAIPKMKKYWDMPRTYKFTTAIDELNKNWIRLEENYFYPEGGGQPYDTGVLEKNNRSFQVIEVQEKEDEVWLKIKDPDFEEGELVNARINKERRENLTRNHSAQHLLSAAFWEEMEYMTQRALIDVHETEIELDHNPEIEEILSALEVVENKISASLPIMSKFYTKEQLKTAELRGELISDHSIYRIVQIGDYDRNPCGGTHLENTSAIETLFISKISGNRIKFTSGEFARMESHKLNLKSHHTSKILGVPVDEILSKTKQILDEKEKYGKQLYDIKNEYLKYQIQSEKWQKKGSFKLKIAQVHEIERGVILDALGELNTNQIGLVLDENNSFIITGGNETLIQDLIQQLREIGIRGGGRGQTVMGSAEDGINLEKKVIEFLSSYNS